jgi:hypothetical protein
VLNFLKANLNLRISFILDSNFGRILNRLKKGILENADYVKHYYSLFLDVLQRTILVQFQDSLRKVGKEG